VTVSGLFSLAKSLSNSKSSFSFCWSKFSWVCLIWREQTLCYQQNKVYCNRTPFLNIMCTTKCYNRNRNNNSTTINPCVGVFLKSSIARYGSFWSCLAFRISCFADIMATMFRAWFPTTRQIFRARESLYWPGMNSQVKDFIRRCETCRTYEKKQQNETLISHEIPSRPWSKVGIDLMKCRDKDYLVTVDYYSNFWEIDYGSM
jgi:hypothetical protein